MVACGLKIQAGEIETENETLPQAKRKEQKLPFLALAIAV